jgi:hypothetical protein
MLSSGQGKILSAPPSGELPEFMQLVPTVSSYFNKKNHEVDFDDEAKILPAPFKGFGQASRYAPAFHFQDRGDR